MVGLNELSKQVAPPRGASRGISRVDATASRDRAPSARRKPPPIRRWPLWTVGAFACLYLALSVTADLSEPIKPIPADVGTDPAKAALGRMLFHDIRLSKDNTISCASCHDLPTGGDDGKIVSLGVAEARGAINSPTVYNAAFNFKQFWDGRADTLHQQIDGPVQSAIEMASLWPDVLGKLYQDDQYPALFEALYSDGITRPNAKDAIAEFLRSLTTPNSPFDRWLTGEAAALTAHERQGYELFKFYGCVSCHQGANVGGNMFQVFGVINEYFKRRGNITEADMGRYNITGNEADIHAFKVPSLRMAAHTAPYLHDGSAATLRDAVDAMFEFQLGRDAPEEDKEAIVAFIKTLAGESEELAQ
ncbi:MAG: cytochrome B6 [Gammaproteobacteria bacterium]|nr:cytochrome B6 [Gammaproteobacteria bacterium]